ncbi:hypothetical protein COOONC_24407 [Cooperia oncophora]
MNRNDALLIGAVVLLLCCAGSVAYTYAITFRDNLPASGLMEMMFTQSHLFFNEFYEAPWVRCTPYLIGLGVGYLVARIGRKKPRLHWVIVVIMWIVATAIALLALFGVHNYIKGDDNWRYIIQKFS